MRIALGVEYEGSSFAGWQTQLHGNTVQDTLERALSAVAGDAIQTHCAGRTDARVHAMGQVIHFDTVVERPESAWVRGVNSHLPPSVAVCWARTVAENFHARFSAESRSYAYRLLNRAVRPAAQHQRVGWFHHPLDVEAMRAGALHLHGEHDFSAFRAAECQAKSPVRQLQCISVSREGELITFDLTANAFLHHMVRNIVGALVIVGKGKHSPDWIRDVLETRDRTQAAPTFGAAGLYLTHVEYPAKFGLPGRGEGIMPR